MDDAGGESPTKQIPVGLDEEEYASVSKLLQEFTNIPAIDKAWTFKSHTGIAAYCFSLYFSSLASIIAEDYIFDLQKMVVMPCS